MNVNERHAVHRIERVGLDKDRELGHRHLKADEAAGRDHGITKRAGGYACLAINPNVHCVAAVLVEIARVPDLLAARG